MPMNIEFDYENALFSIQEEIGRIPAEIKSESKKIIKETANIVKKNVIKNLTALGKSDAVSNYDGSTPYVHMKDDVKTIVRDDKQGAVYAIIKGGKYTGYKWHLVNNGTVKSRATHFVDNALKQSEGEFEAMIDNMLKEVTR
jgi:HK97 gp10 family phage protein